MQFSFTGGAWIIGSSYGTFSSGVPQKLPAIDQLFPRVPARLGRFDDFTKFGFAAVGLALQEAGWTDFAKSDDTGLIISTEYGVMRTDLSYYATTIPEGSLLSSPNLFSYTLPVTVIGECAVFFHLTGPTFCIGDDGKSGIKALETAAFLLQSRQTHRMIAAWIETPPDLGDSQPNRPGAAAVVLEPKPQDPTHENRRTYGTVSDLASLPSLFALFPNLDVSKRYL
jgi:3-oxoacyl-(acyl-carrier-protein) synthase